MRGNTKCTESSYNLVAMITYLHENPRNVMDGRDINFRVDFLFLFFDFFLKSLDLPKLIISITEFLLVT